MAALVGGDAANVVFTSGATEAASTLLQPGWRMARAPVRIARAYVCAADHPCTLGRGHFAADQVSVIGVDGNGLIDIESLERQLSAHDVDAGLALVVMHAANNETGVVQPFETVGRMAKAHGAVVAFDLAGIALSAGSACSSGKVGPSHVLKAMGHGESAGALRVSIGPATGGAELAAFTEVLAGLAGRRKAAA